MPAWLILSPASGNDLWCTGRTPHLTNLIRFSPGNLNGREFSPENRTALISKLWGDSPSPGGGIPRDALIYQLFLLFLQSYEIPQELFIIFLCFYLKLASVCFYCLTTTTWNINQNLDCNSKWWQGLKEKINTSQNPGSLCYADLPQK